MRNGLSILRASNVTPLLLPLCVRVSIRDFTFMKGIYEMEMEGFCDFLDISVHKFFEIGVLKIWSLEIDYFETIESVQFFVFFYFFFK